MSRRIVLIVFFLNWFYGISQERDFLYSVQLNTGVAAGENLPFWMTANQFGVVPTENYSLLQAGVASNSNAAFNKLTLSYKALISASTTATNNDILVNELYASLQYKKWQLDIGAKHQDIVWEGLSSSNGNIAMATNARSFPGYNLQLTDYVQLPFAKKWLSVKGNYGDYLLNDKRSVAHARLHTKSLFFKSHLNEKHELIVGMNHYAQWAGTSSVFGKQPSSFKDYLRVITGSSGGSDALEGDQINVIGNQLGSYLLQFNYTGKNANWNFYWSHPFEDRSGRELMNYPDGLYGVFVDFKKPKAIISHVLAEITYTKHASGDDPHITDETGYHAGSGMDNYFNNGVYQSGWTYFGNMIGSPYFTTTATDENGITQGIITGDNRLLAFNVGFKGMIKKVSYKAMLSHTTYFGWFDDEYSDKPMQLSGLFEVNFADIVLLPFDITAGTAFDNGTYRPVNFGGFIKLTKKGTF